MDNFFASLLLNEGRFTLLIYALFAVGGFICSRLVDVEASYRRVVYLWQSAGLAVAIILSALTFMLAGPAAESGMLSVLIIANFIFYAVAGAAWYIASAGRSNHVTGETSKALIGFIPIAVLYLIFAPGRNRKEESQERSWAARFIGDPILVLGALTVLLAVQALGKIMEDQEPRQGPGNEALAEALTGSMSVEERFAFEADNARSELPMRIDELTTITGFDSQGKTLNITYELSEYIENLGSDVDKEFANEFCSPESFFDEISNGGIIHIEYLNPDRSLIQSIEITSEDCA